MNKNETGLLTKSLTQKNRRLRKKQTTISTIHKHVILPNKNTNKKQAQQMNSTLTQPSNPLCLGSYVSCLSGQTPDQLSTTETVQDGKNPELEYFLLVT